MSINQRRNPVIHFICGEIRPFYSQLIGMMCISCYWGIHISLQSYLIKLILNNVNSSILDVSVPMVLYVILFITRNFIGRINDYLGLEFYSKLKVNIIANAANRINHFSYPFFQNQFAGGLANKVKDLYKGTTEIVRIAVEQFFSNIIALLFACLTLMLIHPVLPLILLLWALFLVAISFFAAKKVSLFSREFSEKVSCVLGNIVDCFTNILSLQLSTAYHYEKKELNRHLQDSIKVEKKLRWYLLKVLFLQGMLTVVMISASLLVLLHAFHSYYITIGDFALVLTLTLSFVDIICRLTEDIARFSETYGLVNQGVVLLNCQNEIDESSSTDELCVTQGEICFENVNFKYSNMKTLFKDKSIHIHKGQKVGLVGFSGSGKSTFVNLILKLFEVTSGRILIDNQDISKVSLESLHRSIALIPQDPTLFHRTLTENIQYGRLDSTDEEVIAAAKQADAHEFIINFPQGYATLVGERGIKLSGGQKQRIIIARAILKNAPILILDEATSALDSFTENLIKNSLSEFMKNKTAIVIAHRLSTLLHMDRILVFEQGKIIEDGTHEELLKNGEKYKNLWKAQIESYIFC